LLIVAASTETECTEIGHVWTLEAQYSGKECSYFQTSSQEQWNFNFAQDANFDGWGQGLDDWWTSTVWHFLLAIGEECCSGYTAPPPPPPAPPVCPDGTTLQPDAVTTVMTCTAACCADEACNGQSNGVDGCTIQACIDEFSTNGHVNCWLADTNGFPYTTEAECSAASGAWMSDSHYGNKLCSTFASQIEQNNWLSSTSMWNFETNTLCGSSPCADLSDVSDECVASPCTPIADWWAGSIHYDMSKIGGDCCNGWVEGGGVDAGGAGGADGEAGGGGSGVGAALTQPPFCPEAHPLLSGTTTAATAPSYFQCFDDTHGCCSDCGAGDNAPGDCTTEPCLAKAADESIGRR